MSTRSKYIRQPQKAQEKGEKLDTDIIMKSSDTYGRYVGRALKLFFEEGKKFIVLTAA